MQIHDMRKASSSSEHSSVEPQKQPATRLRKSIIVIMKDTPKRVVNPDQERLTSAGKMFNKKILRLRVPVRQQLFLRQKAQPERDLAASRPEEAGKKGPRRRQLRPQRVLSIWPKKQTKTEILHLPPHPLSLGLLDRKGAVQQAQLFVQFFGEPES